MKIDINRDDLRCLIIGKYCLMNEFTFDSNNAKYFLEGALFAVDFISKNDLKNDLNGKDLINTFVENMKELEQ